MLQSSDQLKSRVELFLFGPSNGESRGLSAYKLEVVDVSTSSSPLLGVFRVFDVKGVGLHLFVLGAGHQQHPKEVPSHGERRSRAR